MMSSIGRCREGRSCCRWLARNARPWPQRSEPPCRSSTTTLRRPLPPRNLAEVQVTHEVHEIAPAVEPVASCAHEDRRDTELVAPCLNGIVGFGVVVDHVVFDHNDAEGNSLLFDDSKLDHFSGS